MKEYWDMMIDIKKLEAIANPRYHALFRFMRDEGIVTSFGVEEELGMDRRIAGMMLTTLMLKGIVVDTDMSEDVEWNGKHGIARGYRLSDEFDVFLDRLQRILDSLR